MSQNCERRDFSSFFEHFIPPMTSSLQYQSKQKLKQIPLDNLEFALPARLSTQQTRTRHSVKLTLHPSKIHLNQRQALQINELNQRIQSLEVIKPDLVVFNNQIQQINREIDHLKQQIATLREQIDSNNMERRDYEDQNQVVFIPLRTQQSEIDDLMRRRTEIDMELDKIKIVKQNHSAFFSNVKRTYGIANVDEGIDRLDEIDEIIERETLTVSQLRKLLTEKDRIQKGITFLNQSAHSNPEIKSVIQNENELRDELCEILSTLHEIIEERKETRQVFGGAYDKVKTLRDEKKQLISKLKEMRDQLDQKYDERARMTADFQQSQKDYWYNQDEILKLEDEKLIILAEAEITTLKEHHEQHKIKAANSLIHCLERLNQNKNGILSPMGKHKVVQDDLDMIARLRKPSKKLHPKKFEQIPFDIETRKLFDIIGIPIPLSFNEIPATLTILHDMISFENLSKSFPDNSQLSSNHQSSSI
jgi:chromosome segregation ATPase